MFTQLYVPSITVFSFISLFYFFPSDRVCISLIILLSIHPSCYLVFSIALLLSERVFSLLCDPSYILHIMTLWIYSCTYIDRYYTTYVRYFLLHMYVTSYYICTLLLTLWYTMVSITSNRYLILFNLNKSYLILFYFNRLTFVIKLIRIRALKWVALKEKFRVFDSVSWNSFNYLWSYLTKREYFLYQ